MSQRSRHVHVAELGVGQRKIGEDDRPLPVGASSGKAAGGLGEHPLRLLPSSEPNMAGAVVAVDVGAQAIQTTGAGLVEEGHRWVVSVGVGVEPRKAELALRTTRVPGGRGHLRQDRMAPGANDPAGAVGRAGACPLRKVECSLRVATAVQSDHASGRQRKCLQPAAA
jgi:hypothetical protein